RGLAQHLRWHTDRGFVLPPARGGGGNVHRPGRTRAGARHLSLPIQLSHPGNLWGHHDCRHDRDPAELGRDKTSASHAALAAQRARGAVREDFEIPVVAAWRSRSSGGQPLAARAIFSASLLLNLAASMTKRSCVPSEILSMPSSATTEKLSLR